MYYLVTTQRNPGFDPANLPDHKEYMAKIKTSGQMFMTGPFVGTGGGGAYVLQVESLEAAEAIAFGDPLHERGSSTATVRTWDATVL